jgi:hypothetical protein
MPSNTKLSQILAVEKGVKSTTYAALTTAHKELQRSPQLSGLNRTYRPKDDQGDTFPDESTLVQIKAQDVITGIEGMLTRYFDVTATKEWANTGAAADIKVDGQVLVTHAPVTYLLFLEKQLVDLHTFIKKLPALDPAEAWTWDPNTNTYRSAVAETTRFKKVPFNHVKAEATKEHPAQVDVYFEDVPQGKWATTKFSGALPAERIAEMLDRVTKLQEAVKFAREEANSTTVEDQKPGSPLLRYLFGDTE